MQLKNILSISGTVFLTIFFVLGLMFWLIGWPQAAYGLQSSDFRTFAGDVFGSKSGTSTSGANFRVTSTGGQSATSTYVKRVGGAQGLAILSIQILNSSSTANLRWEVQGSNDDYCDTTNTDTAVNTPLTTDINWFGVGEHALNKAQVTSFGNSSSTVFYTWNNPMHGVGHSIPLGNIGYECLRVAVSGSSTVARAELKIK